MRKHRPSLQSRLRSLQNLERNIILDKRRSRLYNRKFRRSLLFISGWLFRSAFIITFVIVAMFYYEPGSLREEVLLHARTEKYTSTSRRGITSGKVLYLETDKGQYSAGVTDLIIPHLQTGDTLLIERNIFNRPVYFSKSSWMKKIGFTTNLMFYYIIFFVTFISLFFNNGMDRSTKFVIGIAILLDTFALAVFFCM